MFQSLRARLILLVVGVACGTAGGIGALDYVRLKSALQEDAMARLAAEARLQATRVVDEFGVLAEDVRILAGTPPIAGISRAIDARGQIDPVDGSSLELWRERLSNIFAAFLETRPQYTQARFIRVADGGLEIVRVNQNGDGVTIVPAAEMQRKGGEPYMVAAMGLKRGDVYFSRVTYNREHGKRVDGAPATIRAVFPVFGPDGALFGALVLNANYVELLRNALPAADAEHDVAVVNAAGDYVKFASARRRADVKLRVEGDWRMPQDLAALRAGPDRELQVVDDRRAAVGVGRIVRFGTSSYSVAVVASAPNDIVFAPARAALRDALLAMAANLVVAALVAVFLAERISAPMRRLAKELRTRPDPFAPLRIPRNAGAEVEELSQAFASLASELADRSALANAVFGGAADGIVTIDETGQILLANPAAHRLFGYTAPSLVGANIEILMPLDLRRVHQGFVDRAERNSGASRRMSSRNITGLRQDGGEVPVDVTVSYIRYQGKGAFVGVMRDISERVAAEAKARSLLHALERSNSELESFAYIASHDLKAPLRAIKQTATWLEQDLAAHFDDDSRENMTMLRSRVARMEKLLDDLLEHSRIGRGDVGSAVVSGADLLDEILDMVAPGPGMRIEATEAFHVAKLRRMPVYTVLLNLVSNAIKHHDRDEGLIRLDVSNWADRLEFEVSDDGPGIAPEYHQKVFGMFQTLRPRDEVDGSGMGLAFVKKSVEVAGGEVTLRSDGRGCVFRFTWPRSQDDRNPVGEAA